MKRVQLVVVMILIISNVYFAQAQSTKEPIVTDRPDQTEAPSLVPQGGLQFELGTSVEKDKHDGVKYTNYTYTTALVKYGVNENFELRLISEYLGERAQFSETETFKVKGLSPLALGVKIRLADEKGLIPQAALIGHINLKSGSEEFTPDYVAADFRFTFAHTLSEKFSLSYNLGAEWNGETPEATFIYTLSLGYQFNDKLGAYAESYAFFPEQSKPDHRFDAGVTYKITPVVQFDVSGGVGITANAPDSFLSTGLSFRLFK